MQNTILFYLTASMLILMFIRELKRREPVMPKRKQTHIVDNEMFKDQIMENYSVLFLRCIFVRCEFTGSNNRFKECEFRGATLFHNQSHFTEDCKFRT